MTDMTKQLQLELQEISRAIDAMLSVAPGQKFMVDGFRGILARKAEEGWTARSVSRFRKEIFGYAKNALTDPQYAAFLDAVSSSSFAEPMKQSVLEAVLKRGRIRSENEFRQVMDELNDVVQRTEQLSEKEERRVSQINALLADFESSHKIAGPR